MRLTDYSVGILCSYLLFASEVLADVCLIDDDDLGGVEVSALRGRLHAHSETERDVRDREDDHTNVRWRVLRDPRQMTLQHVVAIQERLLAIRLHPHLVFGVLGKIVQTRDMQLHLAGLGELAEAGAGANQLVLADVGGHFQNLRIDVVDAVLVEAEDILAVLAVN